MIIADFGDIVPTPNGKRGGKKLSFFKGIWEM